MKKVISRHLSLDGDDPWQEKLALAWRNRPRQQAQQAIINILKGLWGINATVAEMEEHMKAAAYQAVASPPRSVRAPEQEPLSVSVAAKKPDLRNLKL